MAGRGKHGNIKSAEMANSAAARGELLLWSYIVLSGRMSDIPIDGMGAFHFGR